MVTLNDIHKIYVYRNKFRSDKIQVNKNQIQRPSLIEPFFDKELTLDNDYVTYIDCSTNSSSVVHKKSVTPNSHNSKKVLNK